MKVEILKTDKRLGIKKGEVYNAIRYWLDPKEKVTLLSRVLDGYNPHCNQYFEEIKILPPKESNRQSRRKKDF